MVALSSRLRGSLVLLAVMVLAATCGKAENDVPCTNVLFGRPNDDTGLTDNQCRPRCACGGKTWEAPNYGDADVQKALAWTLVDPPAALTDNPYLQTPPEVSADAVCGVLPVAAGSHSYRLVSYDSEAAARAAGAFPTHFGTCGLCSPLTDLAVYMSYQDLTAPVRKCGIANANTSQAEHIACLQALGFDYPCAQIWYYNTINTRQNCLQPCLDTFGLPFHLPDGTLNACLMCDEQISGPVFKAVAGRTRRNTGIANAICRPCSEVRPLAHDYL